jgi:MoaA/NifB/PqqE/SkfB family radical SAM enzyme
MRIEQAKQIFHTEFIQQLDQLLINGNHGDFVTAQDGLEIVKYFLEVNPDLKIEISTNASAKPKIWEPLGQMGVTVDFRIDGLADTHKLYRQNTDWDFIINNARTFIAAGGRAVWTMILFDHNRHQVEECRRLSQELGFNNFWLVDDGRNTMPVFTTDHRLSHIIGNWQGSTNFDELYNNSNSYKTDPLGAVLNEKNNRQIDCYSKKNREIYIAANGEVYPCCWLGFYPTYSDRRSSNIQLKKIMQKNNALEYTIEECIAWFNAVETSWQLTVPEGKIFACNEACGIK